VGIAWTLIAAFYSKILRGPKVNNAASGSGLSRVVNDLGERLRVSYGDSKSVFWHILAKIRR